MRKITKKDLVGLSYFELNCVRILNQTNGVGAAWQYIQGLKDKKRNKRVLCYEGEKHELKVKGDKV